MNVETPNFDPDLHAMAMDRRSLKEQIKGWIQTLALNKREGNELTTEPQRDFFDEVPIEK